MKSFVSARDVFVLHREETFKCPGCFEPALLVGSILAGIGGCFRRGRFGNKQIMRLGARPNAASEKLGSATAGMFQRVALNALTSIPSTEEGPLMLDVGIGDPDL